MQQPLVFLDIETTGLDHVRDFTLELAAVKVDRAYQETDSFSMVVQPSELGWHHRMDEYVLQMHTDNGLLKEIEAGQGDALVAVQRQFLDWLGCGPGTPRADKPIMAGNSIHFDRRFIREQWQAIDNAFHYRMLDVSSIKIMVRDNWPELVPERSPEPAHRALADAREALMSYRHYLEYLSPRRWRARGATQ